MSLGRKILIGFILCGLIIVGVSIYSYINSVKFVDSSEWVDHTNNVIYEFSLIQTASIDAQTAARGYLLLGNAASVEQFDAAKINAFEHINKVRSLTSDNPTQQKNIEALEKALRQQFDYQENYVRLFMENKDSSRAIMASGDGQRYTDIVRNIIVKSVQMEKDLLAVRKRITDTDARSFNAVFIILTMIILLVLISVYIIITANLRALRRAELETANKNWLLSGNAAINNQIQGEKDVQELAEGIVSELAKYLNAETGVVYLVDDNEINFQAGYAFDNALAEQKLKPGVGLIGQAVNDKNIAIINNVPDNYMKISSGLGSAKPKNILVFPFSYAGQVTGVIEIGSLHEFTELDKQLLEMIAENIGIAIQSSQSRARLKELLEETQVQSEELQSQQEELRQVNEELEEQAQNLRQQQEELQITNEELEEQTQLLESKNREVENSRIEIEEKSKQLELSSKYKSEFLANMSHELRTPLNSLLILSRDLAENKNNNLDDDQVESAEIIYKSGEDLLILINEVLDLSKIEAGKMSVQTEKIKLEQLANELNLDFKHLAQQKNLELKVKVGENAPEAITSDPQRLKQILKNLLSNAIKFTNKGSVTLSIDVYNQNSVSFKVTDTGIGIAPEKQALIFEAFQQADGGTSRKYGGTGLGLSISRELAKLLDAQIELSSVPNEGSTFTLIVPLAIQSQQKSSDPVVKKPVVFKPVQNPDAYINHPALQDDRDNIFPEDHVVLIIEDDLQFASVLYKQAHSKGFKCLSASTGEDGILLAIRYKPNAIILDMELPGINGHQVLAELKSNHVVRHIPVHIISGNEKTLKPVKEGAIEYLMKPVSKNELEEAFVRMQNFIDRKMKNLLIIEDDDNSRKAIVKLIGNGDVKCFEAGSAYEAIEQYSKQTFDCIVLDIGLPDINGFELIQKLEADQSQTLPPIIIYTGRELTKEENEELQNYADSIIIKGVKSEERLLDETALFLHRTISRLPESKQNMITGLYDKESVFTGKKILVVDDDMRNVFALSKILKERGMEVVKADNGINALDMLSRTSGIDMVLMDIMMPEMDGYEAMRQIRKQNKFKQLPVIALTAKAMQDDKQKCIDAGANDYISKPIDVERLISLMRVWLTK